MGLAAFFLPVVLPFFVAGAVEGIGLAVDALATASIYTTTHTTAHATAHTTTMVGARGEARKEDKDEGMRQQLSCHHQTMACPPPLRRPCILDAKIIIRITSPLLSPPPPSAAVDCCIFPHHPSLLHNPSSLGHGLALYLLRLLIITLDFL
jgi:hypothetical protein